MAREGRLVLPAVDEGVEFAPLIVQAEGSFVPEAGRERVEVVLDKVTVRLDADGSACGDRFCAERLGMIFPSNRVRIVVATKPVDFRKGHDGLVAYVKRALRRDPFTGTVYVFRSRRNDSLKPVYWDGTGLVMVYKHLEDRGFAWPASATG